METTTAAAVRGYTGPRLKHFVITALIVIPIIFAIAVSQDGPPAAPARIAQHIQQDRNQLVSQPLNLNDRSNPLLNGKELYPTINARVRRIDAELAGWQVTGKPEDVEKRRALVAERKQLTGE